MITKGYVIRGRWIIDQEVGRGSQGTVFTANDTKTGLTVAVKVEEKTVTKKRLEKENDLYKTLQFHKRSISRNPMDLQIGIPDVYYYGEEHTCNVMVMELLGPSLLQLLQYNGRFSLKTTLILFKDLLKGLRNIHNSGIIHHDIKPDNICMGRGNKACVVHYVDFGISKSYINPDTGYHVKKDHCMIFKGTIRYASRNALSGISSSRRDDLESLAYVMMFLMKGELPWTGNGHMSKSDAMLEGHKWRDKNLDSICEGYPPVFKHILSYVRNLRFTQDPDYDILMGIIEDEMRNHSLDNDGYMDWHYDSEGQKILMSDSNMNDLFDEILSQLKSTSSDGEVVDRFLSGTSQSKPEPYFSRKCPDFSSTAEDSTETGQNETDGTTRSPEEINAQMNNHENLSRRNSLPCFKRAKSSLSQSKSRNAQNRQALPDETRTNYDDWSDSIETIGSTQSVNWEGRSGRSSERRRSWSRPIHNCFGTGANQPTEETNGTTENGQRVRKHSPHETAMRPKRRKRAALKRAFHKFHKTWLK